MALGVQLPDQQEGRAEVEEAPEDQADQLGLGRVHHQLAVPDVVAERRVAAHEDALAAAGGELVPDPFARELALELREREQDVQRQPAHRGRGAERLRHRDEGDAVPLEHVDQLGKVGERAGQPVDLVADDGVDPAGLDVPDQPLQRRALQRAAAVPAIVVAVVEREPAFMALAVDVRSAGLALGVEAIEVQLQTLLGTDFRRVDCAADLALDLGSAHAPLPVLRRPKNSGPDHWVPVIARATAERLR